MKPRLMTGHEAHMITYVQILGACTPEILESQKVENSARFWTTFDFDHKYLRNRLRYQKSETSLIDINLYWVQPKKLVNFGLLTKKIQPWMLTYPASTVRIQAT